MLLPKACTLLFVFAAVSALGADIEGVVTFHRPADAYFFLETASGAAWRVQRDANDPRVSTGDIVSVGGHFIKGIATPRFKADVVRMLGHDPSRLPKPERVSIGELLVDPIVDTNAVNRFGRIVTVEGTVRDINRRQTFMQVLLGEGDGVVQAVVPFPIASSTPKDLNLGARVRITGVYVYTTVQDAQLQMENPSVLAARIDDFVIISAAPFWTPLRLWMLIGGILFFGGVLVFWVKSRERAKAVAVQRERLRLSRDLHDGFQQLLAGTMFRLEAATCADGSAGGVVVDDGGERGPEQPVGACEVRGGASCALAGRGAFRVPRGGAPRAAVLFRRDPDGTAGGRG